MIYINMKSLKLYCGYALEIAFILKLSNGFKKTKKDIFKVLIKLHEIRSVISKYFLSVADTL